MRLVSVSSLTQDMVLAKPIYYNDCLLLKDGQDNLPKFAHNFKVLGIDSIYVEDSKCNGIEIPDVISEQTRVSCKHVVYQTLNDFSHNYTIDVKNLTDIITELIDEITKNADIQINLSDIYAADEYTFNHSVNTAVYSLLLAIRMNYSRPMLEKLAIGTLLHDIGKILIDRKILLKKGPLTKEEFECIKQHTTLGYNSLKKCSDMSELSRIIALYHHERMDASGYPTGVPAGTLHKFIRIVAIADVFDALTSNRCYRKKWSNLKASNYLMEMAESKLDINLVTHFIQLIAVYPNGSMVRLSNNTLGIVKEQNRNMPLRPVVRVIADKNGHEIEMYEIDLMKELSVTILDCK